MSDLKPCPFCGGSPIWGIGCHVDNTPYAYRVECQKCKYVTPFYPTREEAIEAWNQRSDDHFRGATKMVERTAKVVDHGYYIGTNLGIVGEPRKGHEWLCENCKKLVHEGDDYCPHCGAKLDWSDNE